MRVVIESDIDRIDLDGYVPSLPPNMWLESDGLEGWYETPGLKSEFQDNPGADGVRFPLYPLQRERTLTIRGFAGPLDSQETGSLRDRLNDLVCRPLKVTVYDTQGERWVRGLVSDSTGLTVYPSDTDLGFSLTLTCPDPLKYGNESSYPVSGRYALVENTGSVPVFPVVRVRSEQPIKFVNIADENGAKVEWASDGARTSIDLDLRSMHVEWGNVTNDDAFTVPHGWSKVYVTMPKFASATVSVTPAWR